MIDRQIKLFSHSISVSAFKVSPRGISINGNILLYFSSRSVRYFRPLLFSPQTIISDEFPAAALRAFFAASSTCICIRRNASRTLLHNFQVLRHRSSETCARRLPGPLSIRRFLSKRFLEFRSAKHVRFDQNNTFFVREQEMMTSDLTDTLTTYPLRGGP